MTPIGYVPVQYFLLYDGTNAVELEASIHDLFPTWTFSEDDDVLTINTFDLSGIQTLSAGGGFRTSDGSLFDAASLASLFLPLSELQNPS